MSLTASSAIPWASRLIPPPHSRGALRRAIGQGGGCILESAAVDGRNGRFSIFAPWPVLRQTTSGNATSDPFDNLAELTRPSVHFEAPPRWPFIGGWIGYVSYEAGRFTEPRGGWRIPRNLQPIMHWVLIDTVLLHDAGTDEWAVAGVEMPEQFGPSSAPLAKRLEALERFVAELERRPCPAAGVSRNPQSSIRNSEFRSGPQAQVAHYPATRAMGSRECSTAIRWNYTHAEYLAKVERVLEYIRAGDIYQANIARRARVAIDGAPIDLYERLCAANPAAYAAYIPIYSPQIRAVSMDIGRRGRSRSTGVQPLPCDRGSDLCQPPPYSAGHRDGSGPCGSTPDFSVLSSSPELFLRVQGREVTTRPIKGTRPRGATPALDAAASEALAASEKDRAELNMIIDLERNDLGRVCEYRTIRVIQDGEIETHPTVFHRTATVTGRLRDGHDVVDLLRAAFPGGSITGAPKVRAMQIIHELEPDPRGAYCGAIGYISLNGDAQLNLAIRTLTVERPGVSRRPLEACLPPPAYVATLHVGSGIVADSDPEDEYRELQAKAAGMLAALKCERP